MNVCQYTEDHGRSLGLSGWVKNTRQGTVIGQVQGPWDKVSDVSLADQSEPPNTHTDTDISFNGFLFENVSAVLQLP